MSQPVVQRTVWIIIWIAHGGQFVGGGVYGSFAFCAGGEGWHKRLVASGLATGFFDAVHDFFDGFVADSVHCAVVVGDDDSGDLAWHAVAGAVWLLDFKVFVGFGGVAEAGLCFFD